MDASGDCSAEVTDMSDSSLLVRNFVQVNHFFNRIFPSFPNYTPFQLKRISLLGFSHLCLSLPGSEVSLVNLGEENENGSKVREGKGESCQCNGKPNHSLVDMFSSIIAKLNNFVWSCFER